MSAAVPPPREVRIAAVHEHVREVIERAMRTQEHVHAMRVSAAQTRADARRLRAELAARRAWIREQLPILGVLDRPAAAAADGTTGSRRDEGFPGA